MYCSDCVKELKALGEALCKGTNFNYSQISDKTKPKGLVTTAPDACSFEMTINMTGMTGLSAVFKSKAEIKNLFVSTLVATYHERHHISQFEEVQEGTAKEEIAVGMLARLHNQNYYDYNYSIAPYEIEAEMYGVLKAHDYLLENHKELDALQEIKKYAERQVKAGDSRYKELDISSCNSIDEIYGKFSALYEKAINEPRRLNAIYSTYSEDTSAYETEPTPETDNLVLYCIAESGEDYENNGRNIARTILDFLPSGMEQSKFIASYTLKVHSEYRDAFPQLQDLDFENYLLAYRDSKEMPNFTTAGAVKRWECFSKNLSQREAEFHKLLLVSADKQASPPVHAREPNKNKEDIER